jgi:glycosyltransferase involved in cell wall biosynthesis
LCLPYHPPESRTDWLGTADLHLVPLERGLAGLIVPSKVYGILAVGGPFVAPIDADSEVAAIIERFHCGIRVEPDSAAQLREAILWAFQHPAELRQMGAQARAAAVRHFDREISVGKFRSLLEELQPDTKRAIAPDSEPSVVARISTGVKS